MIYCNKRKKENRREASEVNSKEDDRVGLTGQVRARLFPDYYNNSGSMGNSNVVY
jgi:hypothetical protein